MTEAEAEFLKSLNKHKEKYIEKMDDDFNTADAITAMFDLAKDINSNLNAESSKEVLNGALSLIEELGAPLGIIQKSTKVSLEDEVEELIRQRQEARKNRDFAMADKIRDDLKARGIVLEDISTGSKMEKTLVRY